MNPKLTLTTLICAALVCLAPAKAQSEDTLSQEVQHTMDLFKKTDSGLTKLFDSSAGYVVFPSVAKGAAGIGAAHGKGQVFEKGSLVGLASLTQVTLGFQLGGQVYAEVIFFENQQALKDFKASQMKLSAQVSAVAAAEGASQDARFQLGVLVFTLAKSGLMFEASVGGQKFNFTPVY